MCTFRFLPEPAEFKAEHVCTHQLVNISNSIVVKIPNKFLLWSMVFWTNYKHQNGSTGSNVLFVKVA